MKIKVRYEVRPKCVEIEIPDHLVDAVRNETHWSRQRVSAEIALIHACEKQVEKAAGDDYLRWESIWDNDDCIVQHI